MSWIAKTESDFFYECHPRYIYPILDWEDHPGLAAGVVTGGCLLMPVLVAFWWCLVRLRQWIKKKTT